jgi:uroporphyrinogen-III decarboxylase
MLFSPLHIPTYLNPRDFGKLYYPFLKKYVQEISVDRGHALYIFMENEWGPYMEYLQDLPKEARLVLLFEHGDLKNYKDKLGKHFTIMGGMPISTLNYGTKQNCVDKAKECIDTLAPGGNYIFSIDRILMTLNDAKPENVIETARFAHEYGKY